MINVNLLKWSFHISNRLTILLAVLSLVGVQAAAEEVAESELNIMEEIVVTAQRREQDLMDVGIALTAFNADSINRQGIDELGKVAALIPGLDVFRGNGSNNPTITLRGIGTTNPWLNNNQSVASYVDGAYLPFGSYLTLPFFDLERIEVMKGPQIALYGRNATAGAVNFISARPSEDSEGYAEVNYGKYDAIEARTALSGAVTDNLQLRLAAIMQQGGGYMDRPGTGALAGFSRIPGTIPGIPEVGPEDDYGDKDRFALRTSAALQIGADVELFLTLHYGQDKSELIGSTNINGDRLGAFTPPDDAAFVDYDNVMPQTDTEQFGGVFQTDWLLGEYTFSSITAYEQLNRAYGIGDFVPTRIAEAFFDENIESMSQEFTLSFDNSETIHWLAGASYTRDDIDYLRDLVSYDLLLGGLRTEFVETDESWAIFGQGEWKPLYEWAFTFGLRFTNEEKSYDGGSIELDPFGTSVVGVVFPNTAGDGLFGSPEYDESNLSGKVAINWEPTDDLLVYASISNGFKSGGFDGSGITEPASFAPFDSETVWTYEVGSKATLFSGHLFMAASAFYNDYEDKQVIALVDLGGGLTEAIIQNAAASKIYGLDFEIQWRPIQSLSFSLSGSLLDSEVTQWISSDPAEIIAHVGNELPGTPSSSLTGRIDWTRPLSEELTLDASVWATNSSEVFRDIANSAALESDDYTIVNTRFDLIFAGGVSVYISIDNLFDEEYVTSVRSLLGMQGEYHGAPRTFAGGVRYEF